MSESTLNYFMSLVEEEQLRTKYFVTTLCWKLYVSFKFINAIMNFFVLFEQCSEETFRNHHFSDSWASKNILIWMHYLQNHRANVDDSQR